MSFNASNFFNADGGPPGSGVYQYDPGSDARSAVTAPGYINNLDDSQNLATGDMINIVNDPTGGYSLEVFSVAVNGDVFVIDHSSVTQGNSFNTLYIKGDADTDGSIRIVFQEGEDNANIERRASGVWNDTGFRFASSSVQIGRDMTLSAVAGFLETNNPSAILGHVKGLIPHIEFDDDGTSQLTTPILDAEGFIDVYIDAVGQAEGTVIGVNLGEVPSRVIEHSFHEVGTIGASASVDVKFFVGTDNTGVLFNKRTLPASDLIANTQLDINYDNDLGIEDASNIFMEFSSDEEFSLKTDVSGNVLTTHETHELATMGVLTENIIYDNDLDHILDNDLNPVYANQF